MHGARSRRVAHVTIGGSDHFRDHDEQVQLDLSSDATNVAVARDALAELARRVGARVDDVKIAVSEAVGNAVVHAYRGGETGTIRVTGRRKRGRLVVTVADDGIGHDPEPR